MAGKIPTLRRDQAGDKARRKAQADSGRPDSFPGSLRVPLAICLGRELAVDARRAGAAGYGLELIIGIACTSSSFRKVKNEASVYAQVAVQKNVAAVESSMEVSGVTCRTQLRQVHTIQPCCIPRIIGRQIANQVEKNHVRRPSLVAALEPPVGAIPIPR